MATGIKGRETAGRTGRRDDTMGQVLRLSLLALVCFVVKSNAGNVVVGLNVYQENSLVCEFAQLLY